MEIAIWLAIIMAVIFSLYFHRVFLNQIKVQHPDVYKKIGEPKVFTKYPRSKKLIIKDLSPDASFTRYAEFMSDKKWVNLNDNKLNRYANLRRYAQYGLGLLVLTAIFANKG